MKKDIVKVQVSLASSDGVRSVLIYNKDSSCMAEFPISEDGVEQLGMKEEPKKFFWAKIPEKRGFIKLLEEAPYQSW